VYYKNKIIVGIIASALLLYPVISSAVMYRFGGGPSGGTYQYYSSAVSILAKNHKIRLLARSSGGSIDNIKKVDKDVYDFAVAYSGHVYMGRNGMFEGDTKKYLNVLVMGFFYGAPAQLIVKKDSEISSAKQLVGKKVGVGNKGSGAAANSELFFRELGIWDSIDAKYLGYRKAASAFSKGQLDAFWVFTGFPTASVIEAALKNDISVLNIYNDSDSVGMFKKYPYFSKVIIPANTYKGVDQDAITFEDSTLWIVSKKVDDDIVYKLLNIVYSEDGLNYMESVHKSSKSMSIKNGIKNVVTPLHPGAEKFWKEKGVLK